MRFKTVGFEPRCFAPPTRTNLAGFAGGIFNCSFQILLLLCGRGLTDLCLLFIVCGYTNCEVSSACFLRAKQGQVGLVDVTESSFFVGASVSSFLRHSVSDCQATKTAGRSLCLQVKQNRNRAMRKLAHSTHRKRGRHIQTRPCRRHTLVFKQSKLWSEDDRKTKW